MYNTYIMKNFNKSKYIGGKAAMWVAILAVVGAALFGIVKLASKQDRGENINASSISTILPSDHVKGGGARAVLIEYSDFQCPACGSYAPVVKKLGEELGEELQIVYRHFPLPQHKNAKLAAVVAEAAGMQGKFWEIHDMIFENQREWSESDKANEIFLGYISQLGLDMDKFSQDIGSAELQKKINNTYIDGVKIGLNSTPTFFLNGEKIVNPRNYEDFKSLIQQTIDKEQEQWYI